MSAMSRRFAAPNGIGIKPSRIESRQRIALRVQHPAMFVYLQTDCRRTVARINFYGVERCLFHRSQTGVGLMLRISDLAVDLLIALSKFRVDAKRGILIHLGDCAFEAGRINANLSDRKSKRLNSSH